MADTAPAADRFGNPFDPIVGYARGPILASTDEEVQRMLKARHMVGTACAPKAPRASMTFPE